MKTSDKKQIEVNDLSSDQYSVGKNIKFKTSMSRSYLRGFSDAYFVVKGTIVFEGDNDDKTRNKNLITKNYTPFR